MRTIASSPRVGPAVVALGLGALSVVAGARRMEAQARCRPLCAPVVMLQPGLIGEDVTGDDGLELDLNARLVTAIPTSLPRTRLVAVVQWAPFRDIGDTRANAPTFQYGGVLTAVNARPLAVEVELLGAYGPSTTPDDVDAQYAHELLAQADVVLKVGELWLDVESRWRQLGAYAMLGHRLTGVPEDRSPWMLLVGATIPITP